MSNRNRAALTQCRLRSTRSKRGIMPRRSGLGVVSAIGPPHPRVVGVPASFPVPGFDTVGDLDLIEPLDRLVAVHRRDVEPYRPAVRGGCLLYTSPSPRDGLLSR